MSASEELADIAAKIIAARYCILKDEPIQVAPWHNGLALDIIDALPSDMLRRLIDDRRGPACSAVIHHGPGHQSTTRCELRGSREHYLSDSGTEVMHEAKLPNGEWVDWEGMEGYTF